MSVKQAVLSSQQGERRKIWVVAIMLEYLWILTYTK